MTSLSTHVLDTMHGRPAAGMRLILTVPDGDQIRSATDADGRCPDLIDSPLPPGGYMLSFAVADYFRDLGIVLPEPPFLDVVNVQFGIAADGGHYHVPLLVSPFAYSTYRGS